MWLYFFFRRLNLEESPTYVWLFFQFYLTTRIVSEDDPVVFTTNNGCFVYFVLNLFITNKIMVMKLRVGHFATKQTPIYCCLSRKFLALQYSPIISKIAEEMFFLVIYVIVKTIHPSSLQKKKANNTLQTKIYNSTCLVICIFQC